MAAPAAGAARYVLAFDTANEVISIGLGTLDPASQAIELVATAEVRAHRASNTQLLPHIDELLAEHGIARGDIACVACGRGPGSFTGVRIAMATAKGVASALGVGLVGFSTLDAVAWNAWAADVRGRLLVAADAMRKEVYPARYALDDSGAHRLEADRVIKAIDVVAEYLPDGPSAGPAVSATRRSAAQDPADPSCAALLRSDDDIDGAQTVAPTAAPADGPDGASFSAGDAERGGAPFDFVAGDALVKYEEVLAPLGAVLSRELWEPTGWGLLLAVQALWQAGEADPFDAVRHNPAFALPVYTRLSDAEENERIRLAKNDPKNLRTGVQDLAPRLDQRATMHDTAILNARPDAAGITYKPLDAAHSAAVAALEARIMGSDAWNEHLVADELPRTDRTWWAAYSGASDGLRLIGYAGGWIVDGDVQILKVGVDPAWRRHGIARELLSRVASDARDLGARTCSLEVRAGNEGAQAFYRALGFESLGKRPRYYSDGEDALIMQGPLPLAHHDVAGMELQIDNALHSQEELRARAGLDGTAEASATRRSAAQPSASCASLLQSDEYIDGVQTVAPPSDGSPLGPGMDPEIEKDGPRVGGSSAWSCGSVLEARDVAFDYADHRALEGVSFAARGFSKIAIVGMSGSGKSTLANLLGGFAEPSEGGFLASWEGEEPRAFDLASDAWRRQVVYIPQDPYIFHATLRENIAFYQPSADEEAIARAVEAMGLQELVAGLPQGLDTPIGEGARDLSGGQAQRIALARAFLDPSRRVLIFDEPTAHLDIETELELKERMLPLMEGRLVLFATHRLHWIHDMDAVMVMEEGRLVEFGAPEELLTRGGALTRLAERTLGGA